MNKAKKRKSAQAFLSVMFFMFGLLVIISAVGSAEQDTITFAKFMWSVFVGLSLMLSGGFLANGVKR